MSCCQKPLLGCMMGRQDSTQAWAPARDAEWCFRRQAKQTVGTCSPQQCSAAVSSPHVSPTLWILAAMESKHLEMQAAGPSITGMRSSADLDLDPDSHVPDSSLPNSASRAGRHALLLLEKKVKVSTPLLTPPVLPPGMGFTAPSGTRGGFALPLAAGGCVLEKEREIPLLQRGWQQEPQVTRGWRNGLCKCSGLSSSESLNRCLSPQSLGLHSAGSGCGCQGSLQRSGKQMVAGRAAISSWATFHMNGCTSILTSGHSCHILSASQLCFGKISYRHRRPWT
ncbi:uncharacterized protein ACIBXB_019057 isoform 1-T2 [Morphnus guianensis]